MKNSKKIMLIVVVIVIAIVIVGCRIHEQKQNERMREVLQNNIDYYNNLQEDIDEVQEKSDNVRKLIEEYNKNK